MAKIFRIYTGGAETYQGWNSSPTFPYDSTARGTIQDPDGATAKHEITSIPSPFARIDLVKTAFKEVCKLASKNINQLDGDTIFHKMVSDSLDVGEIFFNIDKYKDKIEIITWNPSLMINTLMTDGNEGHLFLADALNKYLESDGKTYNFKYLNNVYLLNYIKGPNELNIIGATSPATFFFSGANDLSYIRDIFFADNDRPFDNEYQPLYKRDFDYIKSWWTLSKAINNFSSLFPEIQEYLELTYRAIIDQDKLGQLRNITSANVSDFSSIDVRTKHQTNQVEVIGVNLFKKNCVINPNNDFSIKAEKKLSGSLPLVLPVESGNKYANLRYTNGRWGNEYKAPYLAEVSDISQRALPYDGSKYPYLTISDFLEEIIVRVPHRLNDKFYFNGNINGGDNTYSFLLPLKPLYFKYFSQETLTSSMPDGKPAFEMRVVAGGSVYVTIRIPIQGNNKISYIEYQRMYYVNNNAEISENKNSGAVTSFDFTGFVMPNRRFQSDNDAYYTVSCVSTFSSNYKFQFFKGDNLIHDIPVDCRNRERGYGDYKAETYTIEHNNFDFIRVKNQNGINNILIPIFQPHLSIEDFEFAVDLGTSNTHIEVKKANEKDPESFNYRANELLSVFFLQSYREIEGKQIPIDLTAENDLIDADFIPNTVGVDSDFGFPTRTALSYARTTDWTNKIRTFGLANFNLTFNKRRALQYNARPLVNIKWSSEPNAQSAMQTFIHNIMLLIRNKVIADNGNLYHTKITWFYPNSMSPHRLSQMSQAWNSAYEELFDNNGSTQSLSESVAPIRFYFRRYGTVTNLINVDIGGGTTDIAFSSGGRVNYITSFKFAANSLFEDSFSDINPDNGIIDWFKKDIAIKLGSKPQLSDLLNIFRSNEGQPSNMASFLFTLKDNSATKVLAKNTIDFNLILQNDKKFKIVFIIFYTAIIYHIAQIVKEKGLKLPRHIAFSGNGSKIINIISSNAKSISKYTKLIFEKVTGKQFDTQLDILGLDQNTNPKESTCKGGLVAVDNTENEIEKLILRDSSGGLSTVENTYSSITDEYKTLIIDSVKEFFKFMFKEIPSVFNLDDYFGVENTSIDIARKAYDNDLETYLDRGIELSVRESGNIENRIEDALSFYPIKGFLQDLSSKLNEYYNQNPS